MRFGDLLRTSVLLFGAAATAFLFEVGKFGLAYYLGRESTASSAHCVCRASGC